MCFPTNQLVRLANTPLLSVKPSSTTPSSLSPSAGRSSLQNAVPSSASWAVCQPRVSFVCSQIYRCQLRVSLWSSNLINYPVNWGDAKRKRTFVSMKIKLIALEKLNEGKFPRKITVKLDSNGGDKCKRLRRGTWKSKRMPYSDCLSSFLSSPSKDPEVRIVDKALQE